MFWRKSSKKNGPADPTTPRQKNHEEHGEARIPRDGTAKFLTDFALEQQAPERITIGVLKELVRENPKNASVAFSIFSKMSRWRPAVLLRLLGEDAARQIVSGLKEEERQEVCMEIAQLPATGLHEQTNVLTGFTEIALGVNAALVADPEFAKAIMSPAPAPSSNPSPDPNPDNGSKEAAQTHDAPDGA